MKEWLKESFKRGKVLDSCLGNPRRRVEVSNLQVTHPDLVQNRSAHPRHSDLHNHPDLARRHLVLLSEVKPYQKLVVVNFTLGLVVLIKCVFSMDRQVILKSFVRCLILLHQ